MSTWNLRENTRRFLVLKIRIEDSEVVIKSKEQLDGGMLAMGWGKRSETLVEVGRWLVSVGESRLLEHRPSG